MPISRNTNGPLVRVVRGNKSKWRDPLSELYLQVPSSPPARSAHRRATYALHSRTTALFNKLLKQRAVICAQRPELAKAPEYAAT